MVINTEHGGLGGMDLGCIESCGLPYGKDIRTHILMASAKVQGTRVGEEG